MDASRTGQFICESRKKLGLSLKDLANRLNITDKALSKWERGESLPDTGILLDVADSRSFGR